MAGHEIKYPIGEQSFEVLRKQGYLYVDKTRFIEKIIKGSSYYFLARPRRFGKSLFLSTLKSFFEGRRYLFEGLYADTMDWEWEPYPVIYLDFNLQSYKQESDLDDRMESILRPLEAKYGLSPEIKNHSERLAEIIKAAYYQTGRGVVILVDEYDKPLVNNINNLELLERFRSRMMTIFSNFKSSADYLRLVFLSGVSRFGKLSVFSGLNNLRDISLLPEYSAICGITRNELEANFREGIQSLMAESGRTVEEELGALRRHYDGYHFSENSEDIYNPFSLLNVFGNRRYDNYWIQSGMPTLLAESLKRYDIDLQEFLHVECSRDTLSGIDIATSNPEALFYQTGYLTIKSYDPEDEIYTLGLPNEEVKKGFLTFLLPYYAKIKGNDTSIFVVKLRRDLESGQVEEFMKRMQALFAGISYELNFGNENNVQNALLIVFTLLGMRVDAEFHTSDGRIDILVRTDRYVYIIEVKYDGSAEDALTQIERKKYALPWAVDGREVIAIGINYSTTLRRIDDWQSREIKP